MSERGVFGVDRGIWTDPDFPPEPFTKREAWLWLISAAAWRDTTMRGASGNPIALKRGEVSHSIRFMAEQWRWSKSRVERWIILLKNRDSLRDTSRDNCQVYSIKNYNKFQIVGLPDRDRQEDTERDATGTAPGQERDKVEEGKKGKREESPSLRSGDTRARNAQRDLAEFKAELSGEVEPEPLETFIKLRRKKNGTLTAYAARLFKRDAEACKLSIGDAVDTCISRNWITVKPDWLENRGGARGSPSRSENGFGAYARELREQSDDDDSDDTIRDEHDGPQLDLAVR